MTSFGYLRVLSLKGDMLALRGFFEVRGVDPVEPAPPLVTGIL
jgi:hypothetical protein